MPQGADGDLAGCLRVNVAAEVWANAQRAFGDFGAVECGDRELPLTLLRSDPESKRLLTEHEEGQLDHDAFESGFADRLRAHGVDIQTEGLVAKMQSRLARDEDTIALVADLRAAGVPVVLLSKLAGS